MSEHDDDDNDYDKLDQQVEDVKNSSIKRGTQPVREHSSKVHCLAVPWIRHIISASF